MKRQALLAITGCTAKAFEIWSSRDLLPFGIPSGRWSDYSMGDALALALMLEAAEMTDLDTASKLAAGALPALHPLDPFAFCGSQELFAALIRYDWPDKPKVWDARTVVAGRWQDIEPLARERIADIAPDVRLVGMLTVPVKRIAERLFSAAQELGLPEGEVRAVPEDLTGYPDWFVQEEKARRVLLFTRGNNV
jgi:hypothetical protein